jgi:hypothetical protein
MNANIYMQTCKHKRAEGERESGRERERVKERVKEREWERKRESERGRSLLARKE